MSKLNPISLCWFRRDLRLQDHAALYHALESSKIVYCVFVFDTDILDLLKNREDRRVEFIWNSVQELKEELEKLGSTLYVLSGSAQTLIPEFASKMKAEAVFCNHDYEPQTIARDKAVAHQLIHRGIAFHHYKDQVIFECGEVLNGTGKPFKIFTPYKNAWLKNFTEYDLYAFQTEQYFSSLAKCSPVKLPELKSLGFLPTNLLQLGFPCGMSGAATLFNAFKQRIAYYKERRDFPAENGVSYLSTHLRFGTISVRTLAGHARLVGGQGAQAWLSELIWRDFYQMLLYHNPYVLDQAFKPQFKAIKWNNNENWFEAWCTGRTGYPLIDAGMRQLNQTGFMHNRMRMLTASFLVKDLHIDWRWGEKYFAKHLLDFDLASNNGGWQWAASTGCDAQPWFRVFNPVTQSKRFDPAGRFIRSFVPELASYPDKYIHAPWMLPAGEQQKLGSVIGKDYPLPIVDHAIARQKTLAMFKKIIA
jgi:deoxyribodipyrimidine photo-lyase